MAVLQHHRCPIYNIYNRERRTGHGSPRPGGRGRVGGVQSGKYIRPRREDVHAGAVVGKGRSDIGAGGRSYREGFGGACRGVDTCVVVVISGCHGHHHVLGPQVCYSSVDRIGISSPEAHGSDAPLPVEWSTDSPQARGEPAQAVICYLVYACYDATV